jgi:hypothetical protein
MNAHLPAILTGLEGNIHSFDPAGEIREILSREAIWSHQRRVLHGIVQVERGQLLWRVPAEMLQAREGILVILGLCEGEIDVIGAGC